MTSEEIYNEGYKTGLEEAWEIARIVCYHPSKGGMTVDEMKECFGYVWSSDIMKTCSAEEAKAKYDAWKKKKDAVRVGDLIHTKRSDRDMVVTGIVGSTPVYNVVDIRDGTGTLVLRNEFVTTGKHYDLPWVKHGTD